MVILNIFIQMKSGLPDFFIFIVNSFYKRNIYTLFALNCAVVENLLKQKKLSNQLDQFYTSF